jgi:hypothetical protein
MSVVPVPDDSQRNPDSLDIVEAVMAIEETVGRPLDDPALSPAQRDKLLRAIEEVVNQVCGTSSLSQREQLIRAIAARLREEGFEDPNDLDDDAIGMLVRNLGPKGPRGSSSAAQVENDSPSGSG